MKKILLLLVIFTMVWVSHRHLEIAWNSTCHYDVFGNWVCRDSNGTRTTCHYDVFGNWVCRAN